jgi:hypothetical protein
MTESDELRIIRRVLNDQSVMNEDGKVTAKPKGEIASNSLQSAHDEDATYRKKGSVGQSGYMLGISETCGKDNLFQLITDYAVTPNNVSDIEIIKERLPIIQANTGCTDLYADGGFHSEDVYDIAAESGIKIHLTDMTGSKPTTNLPINDFEIDEDTDIIVRCPGGHVPISVKVSKSQTSAHFLHEDCAYCQLREQCQSKEQVKDRVVHINLKSLRSRRKRDEIKRNKVTNTNKRAGIEGTNSALKRKGQDKLNVRGKEKTTVVSALKVTAQNIKRFIKYMQGGYKSRRDPILQHRILASIPG